MDASKASESTDLKPKENNTLPISWSAIKKVAQEITLPTKKFELNQIGKRTGDVVVITGGARGIGVEVIKKLLQCHFHVVMGIRDVSAGEKLWAKFREAGISTGTVTCFPLDLLSLKSVRTFGEMVLEKVPQINILICNAGIMNTPYLLTEDGFESQFQVNYLSHVLLTDILLPKIIKTAEGNSFAGRIVSVSSTAQYSGQIKNISEIETRATVYNKYKAYCDAKLCQVAYSNHLDKILRMDQTNVYSYSLHPGIIPTELLTTPFFKPGFWSKKVLRTVEDGADVVLCAAASPEFEKTGGLFLMNCKVATPSPESLQENLQTNLWNKSCALLGIKCSS